MTAEKIALVRELHSRTCRCGSTKVANRTFCGACYYTLPAQLRTDLYDRLGEGYEEAYRQACVVLDSKGRLSASPSRKPAPAQGSLL